MHAMPTNTRAAICWEVGRPWEVVDCVVADPRPGEVLVRLEYAGLCHSDDHNVTGDFPAALPVVGGHEGAGIVIAIGEGVDRVAVGDSVMLLPLPTCGKCRYCADGRTYLCDGNLDVMTGARADGTFAFTTRDGRQVGAYGQLGTFSEYTLVQQIRVLRYERDIPGAGRGDHKLRRDHGLRLRSPGGGDPRRRHGCRRRYRRRRDERGHRRCHRRRRPDRGRGPGRLQAGAGAQARRHAHRGERG
jgi:hypothetical protein